MLHIIQHIWSNVWSGQWAVTWAVFNATVIVAEIAFSIGVAVFVAGLMIGTAAQATCSFGGFLISLPQKAGAFRYGLRRSIPMPEFDTVELAALEELNGSASFGEVNIEQA